MALVFLVPCFVFKSNRFKNVHFYENPCHQPHCTVHCISGLISKKIVCKMCTGPSKFKHSMTILVIYLFLRWHEFKENCLKKSNWAFDENPSQQPHFKVQCISGLNSEKVVCKMSAGPSKFENLIKILVISLILVHFISGLNLIKIICKMCTGYTKCDLAYITSRKTKCFFF